MKTGTQNQKRARRKRETSFCKNKGVLFRRYKSEVESYFGHQALDEDVEQIIDRSITYIGELKTEVEQSESPRVCWEDPNFDIDPSELTFYWDFRGWLSFHLHFRLYENSVMVAFDFKNTMYLYEFETDDDDAASNNNYKHRVESDTVKFFKLKETLSSLYSQIDSLVETFETDLQTHDDVEVVEF